MVNQSARFEYKQLNDYIKPRNQRPEIIIKINKPFCKTKPDDFMALYLVQHGKNLPKEQDPDKGLSDEGTAEVKRVAERAKQHGISLAVIKHSGKKRALQTAQILATALNPENGTEEMNGLQPLDDVSEIAKGLENNNNMMLVGHLPFMEKLVSFLITGTGQKPVLKFQNGGIVCLDFHPDTKGWIIKWTLFPDML